MKFYKTNIEGVLVSKSGAIKHGDKILKITKSGYFIINRKAFNFAKFLLENFKGEKMRSGRIIFLDGNKKNFNIDNISYQTKQPPIEVASPIKINQILKYYFGGKAEPDPRNTFDYRTQINTILEQRNFFELYKSEKGIDVLQEYFSITTPALKQISIQFKITLNDARRTVNYFLNRLIEDCIKDGIIKNADF